MWKLGSLQQMKENTEMNNRYLFMNTSCSGMLIAGRGTAKSKPLQSVFGTSTVQGWALPTETAAIQPFPCSRGGDAIRTYLLIDPFQTRGDGLEAFTKCKLDYTSMNANKNARGIKGLFSSPLITRYMYVSPLFILLSQLSTKLTIIIQHCTHWAICQCKGS